MSPERRDVQIRLASDDGFRLWLNGRLVGEASLSRPARRDSTIIETVFEKGANRILFKVSERTGGHAACLRLTDSRGRPMTDVDVMLEIPERKLASTR